MDFTSVACLHFFGVVYYELLAYESSLFAIAHSAHLGGILAGFSTIAGCKKTAEAQLSQVQSLLTKIEPPAWFQSKRKRRHSQLRCQSPRLLANEVDRILDKINKSGFASLNKAEKETLEAMKTLKQ